MSVAAVAVAFNSSALKLVFCNKDAVDTSEEEWPKSGTGEARAEDDDEEEVLELRPIRDALPPLPAPAPY